MPTKRKPQDGRWKDGMWAALIGFFLGLMGWGIANLLFAPLKEIIDLRRETQESLMVHSDLDKDAPDAIRARAAEAFFNLGAGPGLKARRCLPLGDLGLRQASLGHS